MKRGDKVNYEWVFEEEDEHGDIIDCGYWESLEESRNNPSTLNTMEVGLSRSLYHVIGNEGELIDRLYVYVDKKTGQLPDAFGDGTKIPKRFRDELATWLAG